MKEPRQFFVLNRKLNAVDRKKYEDEISYQLSQPGWNGSAITSNEELGKRDGLKVYEASYVEELKAEVEKYRSLFGQECFLCEQKVFELEAAYESEGK